MVGRPRNPNRPPMLKAIRVTDRAYHKLLSHHVGNEPYGMTMERLIDELEATRKKVKVLQLDIEGLEAEIKTRDLANTNLINILKKRDEEIAKLKQERKEYHQEYEPTR